MITETWGRSVVEVVAESNAWDIRYQLPVCPGLNNPWIYSAYMLKLMRENGLSPREEVAILLLFRSFADGCRVATGVFNRWPDGSGGVTSHDELMGMAYILPSLAKEIHDYLESTDGLYLNKPGMKILNPRWELDYNVYRMPWFRPYLRARAGLVDGLITQGVFAAHLLLDAFTTNKEKGLADQGGRLRIWIMLEEMAEAGWLSAIAVAIWRAWMNHLGLSPKLMLEREPRECPIFASLSKERF